MERRVCLFGGSFDPPHVCHVLATSWAISTLDVDALWWMPTWRHAFGKRMRPFDDRMAMCRTAIEGFDDRVQVTDIEARLGGESRTLRTVKALQNAHPSVRFSLLFGADILADAHRWEGWQELAARVDVHVIGRAAPPRDAQATDFAIVLPDVSSTALRDAIRRGDHAFVAARVPRATHALIQHHRWYQDDL